MSSKFLSGLIFLTTIPLWSSALASSPGAGPPALVGDRPDFTESPLALTRGTLQIEAGATWTRAGDIEGYSLGEVLVRGGLGRGLELRLGLNSYGVAEAGAARAAGLEDISAGFKLELTAASGARPDLALLAGLTLPTGASVWRVSRTQPEARLAAGWELGGPWSLGANAGAGSVGDGAERCEQLLGSLSLARDLGSGWGAFLEWFGYSREEPDGPAAHYLDGGVTRQVTPNLQLDARAGRGLKGIDPDWFAGMGVVVRW